MKNCLLCQNQFEEKSTRQIYCSNKCSDKFHNLRAKSDPDKKSLRSKAKIKYTKRRYHTDPEFRRKQLTAIAVSQRKRYLNDPEYRKKKIGWTIASKKRRMTDPEYLQNLRTRESENRIRRKYKLSASQYKFMLLSQDFQCTICGQSFDEIIKPYVDHNHRTNLVRGILCQHCNSIIGFCKENIQILEKVILYLRTHQDNESLTMLPEAST